jgi:hypothetical protein
VGPVGFRGRSRHVGCRVRYAGFRSRGRPYGIRRYKIASTYMHFHMVEHINQEMIFLCNSSYSIHSF